MRKRPLAYVVGFALVAVLAFVATLAAGDRPEYGLDLQGGVSLVLKPRTATDPETLDKAIEIIRNRIDSLGVAEPEISREGGNVLVQIPGVKDQDRAIQLVGTTAKLRFRPVLAELGPPTTTTTTSLAATTTTAGGSTTTAATGETTTTAAPTTTTSTTLAPTTTTVGDTTTTTAGATTTTVVSSKKLTCAELAEQAAGVTTTTTTTIVGPEGPTTTTSTTTTTIAATTTTAAGDVATTTTSTTIPGDTGDGIALTTPEENDRCTEVVLGQYDPKDDTKLIDRWALGPTDLEGDAISSAQATLQDVTASGSGTWAVSLQFKGGADGTDLLNEISVQCYNGSQTCPTRQLAIELDSKVIFAGTVQSQTFDNGQVQLTGGYDQTEAKDLAIALKYGALPVDLQPQNTETVSSTIGRDALHAGVIAGIVGLLFVSALMLAYYRILGALAVASLLLSSALLWAVIAWLGVHRGLVLTLAGITGLIVSIGVSLDSNIVYFEHMKEDVRYGRTTRSAADKSFAGAWGTIIKADLAALIAAGVLYLLTVGSVRGFALYLGIATILDLLATRLFLAPAVWWLARKPSFTTHPGRYGLPNTQQVAAQQDGAGA